MQTSSELTKTTCNHSGAEMHRQSLINDFKSFYGSGMTNLDQLARIYTQDIEYRDPLRRVLGILGLKRHVKRMLLGSSQVIFQISDEQCGDNWASFTWLVSYNKAALMRDKAITLRGTTQIRFTDRIFYQENFYDLGAMIYQHIPLLGWAVRFVNKRNGH